MKLTKLKNVIKHEKERIGNSESKNVRLLGVNNQTGLTTYKGARKKDLSKYFVVEKSFFAYNPMRVNVGSIGLAESEEQTGIISPDYVVFSCTDKVYPKFLLHILKSDYGLDLIRQNTTGAVRQRLYFQNLANIELYLPSYEKQVQVAEKIDAVKAYLSSNKEEESELGIEALKKAILQEAVQGKLTEQWRKENYGAEPASVLLEKIKAEKERLVKEKKIKKQKPLPPIKADEIPFELPEGWLWCRLGEVFNTTSGGTPQRGNSEYWSNGDIGWLKSGELNDGQIIEQPEEKITHMGLQRSSAVLFPENTVLLAMYGATAGKLGILSYASSTNQAICGFFENPFILQKYLFIYLRSIKDKMIRESWGQAQPNISQTYIKKITFPLPPFKEQKSIIEKVESLFSKVSQLEEEVQQNQQYAEQLLQSVLREVMEPEKVNLSFIK